MRFLLAFVTFGWTASLMAEFEQDVREASSKLNDVLAESEKLVVEGRLDEANREILAAFPKETRTAAQAFVLGNILFKHAPKKSYELHKFAAEKLPAEPFAHLEWAMQQHRASEFSAAAKSYEACGKLLPDFAPAWGLQADCLIRAGKTKEAVAAWMKSERAKSGSLKQFESMLCDIKFRTHSDVKRTALIKQVDAGEFAAAGQLVALDCSFDIDWWNSPTRANYLTVDLKLIQNAKWKKASDTGEIVCAAKATIAAAKENGDVTAILKKHGFLLNDVHTLPEDGGMMSCILAATETKRLVTSEQALKLWGESSLARARRSGNAEWYNVAAHLHLGSEKLPDIQTEAWKATSDKRFAIGLLVDLASTRKLTLDHPVFAAARKKYPENAMLTSLEYGIAAQAGKPAKEILVRLIKAEYRKFSIGGRFLPRRSAVGLRKAFHLLQKELAKPE